MSTEQEQINRFTPRRSLQQVWIWVRGPKGAHLETRWIDDEAEDHRELAGGNQ